MNDNLPWYTIGSSIFKKGKYIRQTSSLDSFAIISLKIEPYLAKQRAVFINQITEIDLGRKKSYPLQAKNKETLLDLQMICSGVILGIEAACLALKTKSFVIATIKVTAIKAVVHPVDFHSKAFEKATKSALLEAFNEVELIKV